MKESAKSIFKAVGIYHPLQSFYRSVIASFKNIYYRNKYAKFEGNGIECNVCGSSYSCFVDDIPSAENSTALITNNVISGYGKNIICPHCMSTARERLVIAMLQQTNLVNKKILHFSPEKHIYGFLKNKATVVTADLFPGFYRSIDKNSLTADATSLPFEDKEFDLLIANHILEHISDDRKAISELFRVLKPGGNAVLQVPYSETIPHTIESRAINDPKRQSALFGQKDHVRIYSLSDYISRLEAAGFRVHKISYEELQPLYKNGIQENESFLQISKPIA